MDIEYLLGMKQRLLRSFAQTPIGDPDDPEWDDDEDEEDEEEEEEDEEPLQAIRFVSV